jgi:hypothetical protein
LQGLENSLSRKEMSTMAEIVKILKVLVVEGFEGDHWLGLMDLYFYRVKRIFHFLITSSLNNKMIFI